MSLNLGEVVAYCRLDTAQFDAGVEKCMARLRNFGGTATKAASGVDKLDESLAATGKSSTDAAAGLERSTKATTTQTTAAERAAAAERQHAVATATVRDAMAGLRGESLRVQAATLRVMASRERLTELEQSGAASTRQLAAAQASVISSSRALENAQAAGARSSTRLAQAHSAIAGASKMVRLGLLGIGAASVDEAVKFNSAMVRIQTQAGGSASDVRELSKEVLALGKTAQQGPVELAGALYHLKSVGLDNVTAMRALRTASDLAAVGHADLETTANALAGAWRTGIKGAGDFGQAAATVNAIIGAGNMTLTSFNAALGTGILPSAKTFGLSLKDVGAALALFTDEGVPADEAATRLRMTFSLLGAPTGKAEKALTAIGLSSQDAKGRVDAMEKLLAKAGITTNALATDMRKPNGLVTAIGDLKRHLDDSGVSAETQAALLSKAFGGGRQSATILSLINNYDVLDQKQRQVTASMKSYGDAVAAQRLTPEAKFHQLRAELETTSVELGNRFIPYALQGAKAVEGLVDSFNGMSHSQREVLGWSLGVIAALGPVLNIGSRLRNVGTGFANFTQNTATRLATLAGASETDAARIGIATRRIGLGVSGLLAGTAASAVGGDSTGGYLTSIFLGTAGGWALGGPIGAAVGGVSSAILKGVGLWHQHADAAERAAATERAFVGQLTTAIEQDNGALGVNLRLAVTKQLQDKGILDQAQKLGVSLATVVDAAIGKGGSAAALNNALTGREKADLAKGMSVLRSVHAANAPGALATLASGSTDFSQIRDARGNVVQLTAAQKQQLTTVAQLSASYYGLMKSLKQQGLDVQNAKRTADQYAHALNDNRVQAGRFNDQLEAFRKHATIAMDANGQLTESLGKGSVVGEHNRATLTSMAQAAQVSAERTLALAVAHGTSLPVALKAANRSLAQHITAEEKAAIAAGFNRKGVDDLIGSLGHVPRSVITALEKRGVLPADIQKIIDTYNRIPHQLTTVVSLVTKGNLQSTYSSQVPKFKANAQGGSVPDGYSTVGESSNSRSWEMLYKVGSNVQVISNPAARAMTGWNNVPGFAGGTSGSRKADQGTLSSAVSTAISGIGQPKSLPFDLSEVGLARVRATIQHATSVLNTEIEKGLSKSAAAKYRREIGAMTVEMQHQLAALHVKIDKTDMTAIKRGFAGSADDVRAAYAQLVTDMRAAGYSPAQLAAARRNEGALLKQQAAYEKATAALSAARQVKPDDRSTFTGALTGAFDITTAGQDANGHVTGGAIEAQARQQLTRVRAFVAGMKKLAGMHVLPADYLRELASKGPDALPQVLGLEALPLKDLQSLSGVNKQIDVLSSQFAGSLAGTLDNGAITKAQHAQNVVAERAKTIEQHLAESLPTVAKAVAHEFANSTFGGTVSIDGNGFARLTLKVLNDHRGAVHLATMGAAKHSTHTRGPAH